MTTGDDTRYRVDCVSYLEYPFAEFFLIETYKTLDEAIMETTKVSWDAIEESGNDVYIITDNETRQVVAVSRFIESPKSARPVLFWILTSGKTITRRIEDVHNAVFIGG